MEEENLENFLKYGCDLTFILGSHIRGGVPPYWVRCVENLNHKLCKKISTYDMRKVPQSQRFPRVKAQFRDFYQLFENEFSSPFMTIDEQGKKRANVSWLKINGGANFTEDIQQEEKDIEEQQKDNHNQKQKQDIDVSNLITVNRKNRGISIVLKSKLDETDVDCEFPISEIFEASLLFERYGKKDIKYPFCVLYFIYGCVYHSVPNCSQTVFNELEMFREFSRIKIRSIKEMMPRDDSRVTSYLKKNSFLVNKAGEKVTSELNNLEDKDIEEIGRIMDAGVDDIDSIFQLLGSLTNDKNMKEKLSTDYLANMVKSGMEEKSEENSFEGIFQKYE